MLTRALAIDTSGPITSVAIVRDDGMVRVRESKAIGSHGEELAVVVDELLTEAQCKLGSETELIIGAGPGSFTGLRIGFGFVKGLAAALGSGVAAVSSLHARAFSYFTSHSLVAVVIDARRNEFFFGLYAQREGSVAEPQILPWNELSAVVEQKRRELQMAPDSVVFVADDPLRGCAPARDLSQSLLVLGRPLFESGRFVRGSRALSALQPDYIRAVSAKTIAERGGNVLTEQKS